METACICLLIRLVQSAGCGAESSLVSDLISDLAVCESCPSPTRATKPYVSGEWCALVATRWKNDVASVEQC
jgi:hypothetical protein